jgi:tetratricopeptide (TPR) repeat protein
VALAVTTATHGSVRHASQERRAHPDTSAERREWLVTAAEDSIMSTDLIAVACRLHARALRHHERGRPHRAKLLCRRALRRLVRACGPNHPDVANVQSALGNILLDLGRTGEAARCFHRAVRMLRPLGGDAVLTRLRVQPLTGLGCTYRLQARYPRAAAVYRQALALTQAELGLHDLDTATVLNELGMLGKYTGRFAYAARCYRRARAILSAFHGPDHATLASLYHNLGGLEHARGRHARGEPYARRSLALRCQALGPDHPDVAADEAALAALLQGQGKLDEAEAIYRRVLTVFERVYGPKHYEVAVTLNNLAALYQVRGDTAAAESLYRQALGLKETLLGPRHVDVALTLSNLAALCQRQGRLAEAEALYQRALTIFEPALGPRHPAVVAYREDLLATTAPTGPPIHLRDAKQPCGSHHIQNRPCKSGSIKCWPSWVRGSGLGSFRGWTGVAGRSRITRGNQAQRAVVPRTRCTPPFACPRWPRTQGLRPDRRGIGQGLTVDAGEWCAGKFSRVAAGFCPPLLS